MVLRLLKINGLLTLEPLITPGRDSLAPDPSIKIARAILRKLILVSHNAFNEKLIMKADDLFACAASHGHHPIANSGLLAEAGFDILYEGCAEPHSIEIAPPHVLRLQDPADAPRILLFLAKRGFQKFQQLVLALILTSAAFGAGGILADDVDDDNDGESMAHHPNG